MYASPVSTYDAAYQRAYYLAHRKKRIADANLRQKVKRKEVRASRKARYWTQNGFRESELARLAKHREKNRERLNAQRRATYWKDPEKSRKRIRDYHVANPDQMRTRVIKRRASMRGAVGSHTTQEWQEKKMLFGNRCAYCGEEKPLQREHDIPLERGGSNYIFNILPSCRLCNQRKFLKTSYEFLGLLERRVSPLKRLPRLLRSR